MDNQQIRTGSTYARYLLEEWMEISELAKEIRLNLLYFVDNIDKDDFKISNQEKGDFYSFTSKLLNLYSNLYSKIISRDFDSEFLKNFKAFEDYNYKPQKLLEENNIDKLFELERVVEEGLEKLDIFKFEQGE